MRNTIHVRPLANQVARRCFLFGVQSDISSFICSLLRLSRSAKECRASGRTLALMDPWWCEAIAWWRGLVQAGYSPDRVYEWPAGRWGYRVAYDLSTVAASASEGSSSASVAGAVIGHAG